MSRSVIISFARTPFGKHGGMLKSFSAVELGTIALKEAIRRSGITAETIEQVIFGQVLSGGCGQIPARQVSINSGIPASVPVDQINKVCASSMRALTLADQIIRAGDAKIIATGGMESMSNAPFISADFRWGHKMFNAMFEDLMIKDGLWCPTYDVHMAVHGGTVAIKHGITREMQDKWAVMSQQKAQKATENGYILREITKVEIPNIGYIQRDEPIRPNTTYEALAKLKPLFTPDNTVTAGNAPGVNDGGAAIIVMDENRAKNENVIPEAAIISHAMVSEDPSNIATAPGKAILKLLQDVGMTVEDIDIFEINEAFAAVALLSAKIVNCSYEKLNVNGGAIAFGHPLGASGARIVMTLVSTLQRLNKKYGIAAICSGMGQGDAVLIENCKYQG